MEKQEWIEKCQHWKNKWSVFDEQPDLLNDKKGINLYAFSKILNQNLKKDSVVTWDAGSTLYVNNQSLRLNGKEQRSIGSLAQAEMFACLGISAGVSFARNKGEVLCCCGDGSLQGQIQCLALIRYHNLPIKIFVWNNSGFLSIKNSQLKFYEGRLIGTDSKDGYFFPQTENIAKTYEIPYKKISTIQELETQLPLIIGSEGNLICEVICQELQEISPGVTAKKMPDGKLEQCDFSNIAPFLSEEEYNKEMIKD